MKRKFILTMALFLTCSFSQPMVFIEAKTVEELQQEKQKLEQNKQNAKNALDNAKAKQNSINMEISQLDQSVATAQNELDEVNQQLEETQQKLKESETALAEATAKKEIQLQTFKKRIKYIYENGNIGYLQTILEAKSFDDLLLRMQYVNDIMEYDKTTLEELKKNQEIIRVKTEVIKTERDRVSILVEEQKQKYEQLQKKLSEKKLVAESYRQDAAKYEQELDSWTRASQEVQNLINQAAKEAAAKAAREAAAREAAARQAAAKAAQQNKSNNTSTASSSASTASSNNDGDSSYHAEYTGGQFQWPVPGRSYISSGYGYRDRPIGSGREFHTGYDIPGSYGQDIVAAASGRVITAGYVNGYGYTVMIDHGSGLVTLYGHNSKLVVSKGDVVSAGQVIAKCGSTGNSTGNHCHFEVRLNGSHTSPRPYLGV